MKSTIEVTVLDESLYSKFMSTNWFINIFTRSKIILHLDGNKHILQARETPYIFDVEVGSHTMVFTDPGAKGKRFNRGLGGAIWGGLLGGFGGGLGGALGGSITGASLANGSNSNGANQVMLNPKARLCLRCRATHKGEVQVEQASYTNH